MAEKNYVATWTDYDNRKVIVYERDPDTGERTRKEWEPPYYFYVPDEEGEYTSIFGDKLERLDFDNVWQYKEGLKLWDKKFESDYQPPARVLMDNYYGKPTPPVNYAFFDIEVDYKQSIGFASPTAEGAYAPINAVTVYQSWSKRFLTFAVCPPGVDRETFALPTEKEMREEFKFDVTPEIFLCADERELMECFLDTIQDADIISGWYSEYFDLPYICERMIRLGIDLRSLGLPGAPPPQKRMVNRFGNEDPIYAMTGRSHLDYLRLFEKFTFEGRTSYSLANIAFEELDVPKLEYEGTLEELYTGTYRPDTTKKDPEKYDKPGLTNQLHTKQIDRELIRLEMKKRGLISE